MRDLRGRPREFRVQQADALYSRILKERFLGPGLPEVVKEAMRSMGLFGDMFGIFLGYVWDTFLFCFICLGYVWDMFWIVFDIFGICLGYVWDMILICF